MSTPEPPLPHLTGTKPKSARKPDPPMDKNSARFMMGLASFLLVVSLFLWKTTFDLRQINHGWTWDTIVLVVVNLVLDGVCAVFFRSGWQQWSKIAGKSGPISLADTALGELATSEPAKKYKPKPLAMAIVFFIGFLVEAGLGVWILLTTAKYHLPISNLLFSAFCSLGFLAGSIWAFRWWLRKPKEPLA